LQQPNGLCLKAKAATNGAKRQAMTALPLFSSHKKIRQCRTIAAMHTVSETAIFQKYANEVWSESERVEFINWIAANPLSGDLVPGSNGCRKVRWGRGGMGKRGGARVIYFNEFQGRIWLLIVYAKAKYDNLPAEFLTRLKNEVSDG
jgi:hypothetical protein